MNLNSITVNFHGLVLDVEFEEVNVGAESREDWEIHLHRAKAAVRIEPGNPPVTLTSNVLLAFTDRSELHEIVVDAVERRERKIEEELQQP